MTTTTGFGQPDRGRHPDGVHRDQWKRPIFPVPDEPGATTKCRYCGEQVPGKAFTRVTRFIDVLDDKFGLERWFQRQIAKGMALKEHLVLAAANALDPANPDTESQALDRVCAQAADAAGAHDASNRGSELHRTIERILRGEDVKVPAPFRPDVQALYDQFAAHRFRVAPGDIEVNVVLDGVVVQKTARGIAGRYDITVTTAEPCPVCGRDRRVADLKTGRVDYGADKFRMQLAAYAAGRRVDPATGARTDNGLCQCAAYVVHLPAGRGECTIMIADLDRGRRGLAHCYEVWRWRLEGGELAPADPPDAQPDQVMAQVDAAPDRASIQALWQQCTRSGLWTAEHAIAAERRLIAIEGPKGG